MGKNTSAGERFQTADKHKRGRVSALQRRVTQHRTPGSAEQQHTYDPASFCGWDSGSSCAGQLAITMAKASPEGRGACFQAHTRSSRPAVGGRPLRGAARSGHLACTGTSWRLRESARGGPSLFVTSSTSRLLVCCSALIRRPASRGGATEGENAGRQGHVRPRGSTSPAVRELDTPPTPTAKNHQV